MIKKDVIELYNGLKGVSKFPGVKFAYTIARNLEVLKPEVNSLMKAVAHSEDYKKYDQERIELAKKHAKKDEHNRPMMTDDQKNYILEDENDFEKDFKDLNLKNKKVVDAREKQIKEYNSLLETEISLKLVKISTTLLPESITGELVEAIFPILIEETVEKPVKKMGKNR